MKSKRKFIWIISLFLLALFVIFFLWWNFGADSTDSKYHKNWSTSDNSMSFTSINQKGIFGSALWAYPGKLKYHDKTYNIEVELKGGDGFTIYCGSDIIASGESSYNPFLGRITAKITDFYEGYYEMFNGRFELNKEYVFFKE